MGALIFAGERNERCNQVMRKVWVLMVMLIFMSSCVAATPASPHNDGYYDPTDHVDKCQEYKKTDLNKKIEKFAGGVKKIAKSAEKKVKRTIKKVKRKK